jgi:hypothetical protein
VTFEEQAELLLEGPFAMVLLLVGDIRFNLLDCRRTDGESAVARLPLKIVQVRPLSFDPFRRRLLDFLQQVGHRHCAGEMAKDMDVVFNCVDLQRWTTEIIERPNEVTIESLTKRRIFEKRSAVLRAEYDMNQDFGEGLGHRFCLLSVIVVLHRDGL